MFNNIGTICLIYTIYWNTKTSFRATSQIHTNLFLYIGRKLIGNKEATLSSAVVARLQVTKQEITQLIKKKPLHPLLEVRYTSFRTNVTYWLFVFLFCNFKATAILMSPHWECTWKYMVCLLSRNCNSAGLTLHLTVGKKRLSHFCGLFWTSLLFNTPTSIVVYSPKN